MPKALILCAALFLIACSEPHAKLGEQAPELSARTTANKLVKLERSKIEIVEFWENGCVACLKVMDDLEAYALEKGIKVYAINSINKLEIIKHHEKDKAFRAIQFLKDNHSITWERYDIFAVPTLFVLKDGVLKEKILGDRGIAFIINKIQPYLNEA